ncbi:type 2 lantibiotic [Enterococcus plantarum]|uniref:Type 2 lantibiotic n=2 Tax=Enterococcus plantarum TaxID=1077675 RepID=A0A2W4A7E8_9ENTE|nr:lichenicidin A2 family type 2 lantibiotic [Enterococcus plantarum]PZL76953.1 type 2 lantibiotic [Enterococcus plantarum]
MSNMDMQKVVGETFEDLSIAEMTMVQGSGDVNGEFTTSPACLYSVMVTLKTSSVPCAGASVGAVVSIARC